MDEKKEKVGKLIDEARAAGLAGADWCVGLGVDKVADEFIRQVRISFRRDASLAFRKRRLKAAVEAFEADRSFSGRIVIDVDPI